MASEQYQHETMTALVGIEEVKNISSDKIVHASNYELTQPTTPCTSEEIGLTLNAERYQFNKDKLIFIEMLLSPLKE